MSVTGFTNAGIVLEGPGSDVVVGDFIGVNLLGGPGGNGGSIFGTSAGITILNSPNNSIGGTTPAESNVISWNGGVATRVPGIDVTGANSSGNLIEGNYIGTNPAGNGSAANTGDGVLIEAGANDNSVGGCATCAGNIISGNGGNGVEITGVSSTNNFVYGNDIGVDSNEKFALPNADGVKITDASGTTIGGPGGYSNLIGGNTLDGIQVLDTTGTNVVGTTIQNNVITDNAQDGVWIDNAGLSLISGGNVITANKDSGIEISGSGAVLNLVEGNMIGTDQFGTFYDRQPGRRRPDRQRRHRQHHRRDRQHGHQRHL